MIHHSNEALRRRIELKARVLTHPYLEDVPPDADPTTLICLPRRGDRLFIPAFQLRNGQVHPTVAHINRNLLTHQDPWNAAAWWLDPHHRLDNTAPATLLGTLAEPELLTLRTT